MEQYYIVVYNEALHLFLEPETAGQSEARAKEYAREKESEYSQVGCHKVILLKEVSFKK